MRSTDCKWCGEAILSDYDKQFCNDACRARYHRECNRLGRLMVENELFTIKDLKRVSGQPDDTAWAKLTERMPFLSERRKDYEQVIDFIVRATGIALPTLMNRTRKIAISDARAALIFLLIETAGANRQQIARLLNRTVGEIDDLYSALRKKVQHRPDFRKKLSNLKERFHGRKIELERQGPGAPQDADANA